MIPKEILSQVGTPVTALTQVAFQCQRCGACCRDRISEPIILTGYDMYKLAGALGMRSTMNLLETQIVSVSQTAYGLPMCVLSVTPEGACCLLEGSDCAVHEAKPAVCALYPLGRVYDAEEGSYTYIQPHGNRCAGTGKGHAMAAMQWLAEVRDEEQLYAACEQAYVEATKAFMEITNERYLERAFNRTIWALFCGFSPRKPFLPQLEENLRGLRPLLKKANKKSR